VSGRVIDEIASGARYQQATQDLARAMERPEEEVREEALAGLKEMVPRIHPAGVGAWLRFSRWLSRGYTPDVAPQELARVRELSRDHAVAFLFSHRSYLDSFVLRRVLNDHGFEPNLVFGGINGAFWPLGDFARSTGTVFIRRSFRDDPVYKMVIRQYMAYIVEKGFNVEWSIEGGRTRTGKLRPPRLGLMAYLVDAFRQQDTADLYLVPTAIVYDHQYDLGPLAAEQHGAPKKPEGIGWLIRYAQAVGQAEGDKAYVRFGTPLSLREALADFGGTEDAGQPDHTVERVAIEVSHRINRATPITATSLVTLALLGVEDRAVTFDEVRATLDPLLEYVEQRGLPLAADVDLRTTRGLRSALDGVTKAGVTTCFDGGTEPVWSIERDRHLEAAFYRNAAIHFFVDRAIVEVALARIAEGPGGRTAWAEALELRDLLKFEFFFGSKRDFEREVLEEVAIIHPDWSEEHPPEPAEAWAFLSRARVHLAPRVLRPFLEAYLIFAQRLAAKEERVPVDEDALLSECVGVGRQLLKQRRVNSAESVSLDLFRSALKLAHNRGLVELDGEVLADRRRQFAEEIGAAVDSVQKLRELELSSARS